MGGIAVVAFGLSVSKTKTEIMCLRAKGMPESTAIFSVEAAGQVYNQTNEFVYLAGEHQPQCRPVHRGRPAHTPRMMQIQEVHPRTVRPIECFPQTQIRMLRAEVLETRLYGCVTWNPRAYHYDTLRRAHHRFLTRCIGWRKHNNRADHPISYLDMLIKT